MVKVIFRRFSGIFRAGGAPPLPLTLPATRLRRYADTATAKKDGGAIFLASTIQVHIFCLLSLTASFR